MLNRIRRHLYHSARILGDINAISRGPRATAKRVVRKSIWRWIFRLLR